MPRISHKILTETLRDLEKHGLVTREVRSELPLRVEYSISGHGETVRPVIEAMRAWGHVHIAAAPDTPERNEGLQSSGTAAAPPVERDGAAIGG
jgi:DNA-binding HxlR family transcriptional regulator